MKDIIIILDSKWIIQFAAMFVQKKKKTEIILLVFAGKFVA